MNPIFSHFSLLSWIMGPVCDKCSYWPQMTFEYYKAYGTPYILYRHSTFLTVSLYKQMLSEL